MSNRAGLDIEEQLKQYRAHKRKVEETEARKKRIWNFIPWIMSFVPTTSTPSHSSSDSFTDSSSSSDKNLVSDEKYENTGKEKGLRRRPGLSKESSASDSQEFPKSSFIDTYSYTDWSILILKFIMWLLLVKIFIIIEFGAVFFIFSAFMFIWYNMRTEPKRKGEISAYSVFNPNCETIEGTFTAEQFERELLHKMYFWIVIQAARSLFLRKAFLMTPGGFESGTIELAILKNLHKDPEIMCQTLLEVILAQTQVRNPKVATFQSFFKGVYDSYTTLLQ